MMLRTVYVYSRRSFQSPSGIPSPSESAAAGSVKYLCTSWKSLRPSPSLSASGGGAAIAAVAAVSPAQAGPFYISVLGGVNWLEDERIFTTNSTTAGNRLDQRLAEICTNMKTLGIIVYTITLGLYDGATQSLYRTCATDPGKYFNSPSSAELQAAFRAIGAELSNLRIAQ